MNLLIILGIIVSMVLSGYAIFHLFTKEFNIPFEEWGVFHWIITLFGIIHSPISLLSISVYISVK